MNSDVAQGPERPLGPQSLRSAPVWFVPLLLFAGGLLVFIPAAGDFVNAQFLGNPQTTMIGNSIQDQFLRQLNYPVASAMSFVLMIIITIIVLIYTKFMGTEDLA